MSIIRNHSTRWLFCMLLLLAAMQAWAIWTYSPTIDEKAHLPAGLANWQLGRFDLYAVNPPLIKMVAAAPVCAMDPVTDWAHGLGATGTRHEFRVGRYFIEQNGYETLRYLRVARLACIPFSLLGAWVCFLWGRAAFGTSSGLLAALLWCLSPMILGHGSLITPDVGATAVGLAAVYRFRLWLLDTSWWNAVVLGVVTGMALLTKFTWIPVFPLTAIIMLPIWRRGDGGIRLHWQRDVAHLCIASLVALYFVNAMYAFDGSFTQLGRFGFVSKTLKGDLALTNPQSNARNAVGNRFSNSWIGKIPVPLPTHYVLGIDIQRRDFETAGHTNSYLMGEWRTTGWWYYYIVAFAVKEPVPVLILIAWAVTMCIGRRVRNRRCLQDTSGETAGLRNSSREQVLLIVPTFLLCLLVMSHTAFSHHLRYLLPAYPFVYLFASQVAGAAASYYAARWSLGGLITWQFLAVALTGPNWISYFNVVSGGPGNGSAWLLNSNIDWGQDLLQVQQWQREHPDKPLHLALDGDSARIFGVRSRYSPTESYGDVGQKHYSPPAPGWHAVSVKLLRSDRWILKDSLGKTVGVPDHSRFFQQLEPQDFAGSVPVFYVPERESDLRQPVADQEVNGETMNSAHLGDTENETDTESARSPRPRER